MGQRVQKLRWIVVLACLVLLFAAARPSAAADARGGQAAVALPQQGAQLRVQPATTGDSQCFPETSKCVSGRFLAFWLAHGGLSINGLPLTDERMETLEDGKSYLVQWFERVRMEYHPENPAPNDVLLGQFGRRIHLADPPVAPQAGQSYFAATGHNMAPDLFAFWDANGGLAQFGYPISEAFPEQLEDGKTYTVQYTERARLERHPENLPPNDIQLGQFGRRLLAGGGASPSPEPSTSPVPSASPLPSTAPAPHPGAPISIAPQRGPNWTLFVVAGVGFAPNTTYYLQVVAQGGQNQVTTSNPGTKSDQDGLLVVKFSFGDGVSPGTYTAHITNAPTGGQALASVDFILTGPVGQKAGPFIAVTPARVRADERFLVTVAGLAPNTTYTLRVQTEDRQTTISFDDSRLPSDADGVVLAYFVLPAPRAPGVYIAEVLSKGESPQVLTGTKFTLAAANAPALALLGPPGGGCVSIAAPELAWVTRHSGPMFG
jgi:hypothetical protein